MTAIDAARRLDDILDQFDDEQERIIRYALDHRECLIQRMADEIERLLAQRRGDANALRMIAEALQVPEDERHDGGIMRAITELTDAEILATYGRDDGWREWAAVGAWLYPGDRIVVLRREEER